MEKLFLIFVAAVISGCASYHSAAERKNTLLREGSSLLQYGDLEQAKVRFEKVLKEDMNNPYALNYMGNVYEREGRYQNALTMYQKVANRDLTFIEELDALTFNGMTITKLAEKNVERVRSIILNKILTEVEVTRKELAGIKTIAMEGREQEQEKASATAGLMDSKTAYDLEKDNLENLLALYKTAYEDFMNQEYDKSLKEFTKILEISRDHRLSDNAQYWIAEIYYSTKDFNAALEAFRKVITDFSDGNKVQDAMLKLGYTYEALNDRKSAESIFKTIIKSYPNTDIADKARKKLSSL